MVRNNSVLHLQRSSNAKLCHFGGGAFSVPFPTLWDAVGLLAWETLLCLFPGTSLPKGEAAMEKWHCPVGGKRRNDLVLCLTLAPGSLDINWT